MTTTETTEHDTVRNPAGPLTITEATPLPASASEPPTFLPLAGGLVRSVHASADLLPAARALALEIAENTAPVSVALTRQMLWRMAGAASPWDAHRLDSRAIYARGRAGDAKEGVVSFLEKRAPVYPDKVSTDMPDFYPWWEMETYS